MKSIQFIKQISNNIKNKLKYPIFNKITNNSKLSASLTISTGAFAFFSIVNCQQQNQNNDKNVESVQLVPEDQLTQLYPPIEPYKTGRLQVSNIHNLYYEEVGNPNGKAVVFVHGGPGGGCADIFRQFFDPKLYRIILFDQRGCGKSTPHACLEQNTTWDCVEDMEKLRKELNIDKWQVFGGSWGSTLALAYAETHPSQVTELVLRGIFMLRKKELDFFYQNGSSFIFPDEWELYRDHIPENERDNFIYAYHKRLTSPDINVQLAAAKVWTTWESATSKLIQDKKAIADKQEDMFALAFARIENHYFINKGFFKTDEQLLENVHKIRHIPTIIVQGRYDLVCPITSAWDLHRRFPEAQLKIVQNAGHSSLEKGMTSELVKATDLFAKK